MATNNTNKIFRAYQGSDSFLLSENRVIRDIFLLHQAEFAAKDPSMTVAWGTTWLNAIVAGEGHVTDELYRDEMRDLRADVEEVMVKIRSKYKDVIYFAEKAFGEGSPKVDQFGKNDYDGVRNKASAMGQFLKTMFDVCTKYTAELTHINIGMTAPEIAAIPTLKAELEVVVSIYQQHVRARRQTTRERVEAHNAVYKFTRQVEEASKRVYPNNPDMQEQFQYRANVAANQDDNHILTGDIAAGAKQELLDVPNQPTRTYKLEAKDADLSFGLSEDGITIVGTTINVPNGTILNKTTADFAAPATATKLLVIGDPIKNGAYKVVVKEFEGDEDI